jgi:peptide/nickel transport system permease protein
VKHNTPADYIVTFLSALLRAMPGFWLAIIHAIYLSLQTRLVPGVRHGNNAGTLSAPLFAVCAACVATNIRSNRTCGARRHRSDYVRTARAKGAAKVVVIMKHALRNALIAQSLPVFGLGIRRRSRRLSGHRNRVFAIPGISTYLTSAVKTRGHAHHHGLAFCRYPCLLAL